MGRRRYAGPVRRPAPSNSTSRVARRSSGMGRPGSTWRARTEGRGPPAVPIDRSTGRRRRGLAIVLLAMAMGAGPARAEDIVAVYAAYWAGLPASEIRLRLHQGDAAYHNEIEIKTKGLPSLITRFRGT